MITILGTLCSLAGLVSVLIGLYTLWEYGIWSTERPQRLVQAQIVFLAVAWLACLAMLVVIAL